LSTNISLSQTISYKHLIKAVNCMVVVNIVVKAFAEELK